MTKSFLCGCCGMRFQSTTKEQKKHDQDDGYGICPRCAQQAEERNEQEWQKLEKLVSDSLNETNKAKFLDMELEVRRGLCLKMIDDGIVTFEITRGVKV